MVWLTLMSALSNGLDKPQVGWALWMGHLLSLCHVTTTTGLPLPLI